MRKPIIVGNWKMHKTMKHAAEFATEFKKLYDRKEVEVGICAPFTQIELLEGMFHDTSVGIGAQNVHYEESGAYTGEVSIEMLKEIGIKYCIVGHSERRMYFGETDKTVNLKLNKIFEASEIVPILCVGENIDERKSGKAVEKVHNQLRKDLENINREDAKKLVVAYEPIWAIGTGETATPEQAEEMCKEIRNELAKIFDQEIAEAIRIQYGGSVKPGNVAEIMKKDNIDGALVGGASLEAETFNKIVMF